MSVVRLGCLLLLVACAPTVIVDRGVDARVPDSTSPDSASPDSVVSADGALPVDGGPRDAHVPLDTTRPDSTIDSSLREPIGLTSWGACAGLSPALTPSRIDCATLTVPIDWSDTAGSPRLRLDVLRRKATSARIGVLAWNPGGPGGASYAIEAPQSLDPTIAARFDYVTMNWRGLANTSMPIRCMSEATRARLAALDRGTPSTDVCSASVAVAREIAIDCTARLDPLLARHLGLASAARDLEALRVALGESQLNFLAYSYGTLLAGTYAALFPTRVRAFVLDSCMGRSGDWLVETTEQARALEASVTRWLSWCAANGTLCPFARGRSSTELGTALDTLLAELRATPRTVGGTTVNDGHLRTLLMIRTPYVNALATLGGELDAIERGAAEALRSVDAAFYPSANPAVETETLAYFAIGAMDRRFPSSLTPEALCASVTSIDATAPRVGGAAVMQDAFGYFWPFTSADAAVTITAPTAPPMLFIGGRNDALAPYANTTAMRDAMANGSHLITYEGEGHAVSGVNTCLRAQVTAFLVNPVAAPTVSSCF